MYKYYEEWTLYCPKCRNKIAYDQVRDPSVLLMRQALLQCKKCGAWAYHEKYKEPALISQRELLKNDKKDANNLIFLLWFPLGFFFIMVSILATKGIGLLVVLPLLIFLTIKISKRKRSDPFMKYEAMLKESVERIKNIPGYGETIIKLQGKPEDCYLVLKDNTL